MVETLDHLGEVVRRLRLRLGITQTDAASEADLSRNQLVAIENGSRNPSPEALSRISQVLGVVPRRMSELQVNLRQGADYPADWEALIPYLRGDVDDPPTSDWERQRLTDNLERWFTLRPAAEAGRGIGQGSDSVAGQDAERDPWKIWTEAASAIAETSANDDQMSAQSVLRTVLRQAFTPTDQDERHQRAATIDRVQTTLLAMSNRDLARVDSYIDGLLDSQWGPTGLRTTSRYSGDSNEQAGTPPVPSARSC